MRFMLVSVALFAVACGSAPTAPSPPPSTTVTTSASGDPGPSPAPTPTPAPTPAPVPAPPQIVVWDAATTGAHWYGSAVLPSAFSVSWNPQQVTFGPLTATVVSIDTRTILAKVSASAPEIMIVFDDAKGTGSWTYSGSAGQASGALTRR